MERVTLYLFFDCLLEFSCVGWVISFILVVYIIEKVRIIFIVFLLMSEK